MKRRSIITLVVCLLALKGYTGEPTPRIRMNLDSDWRFHFAYDVRKNAPHQQVTLPHTWNAEDVFGGRLRYYRDMGIYERELTYDPAWKGKRVFLFFEGANSVADVLVNRQFVTQHKGGYTAFCAEITPYLQADTGNTLTVHVSNAARMDVLPLAGDFNVYGGLHRSVWLLVTEENCISPLDYASSGVYIRTEKITGTEASVSVVTKLSLMSPTPGLEVRTMVKDAAGIEVAYEQTTVSAADSRTHQQLVISEPHRWNGKADPYRYAVTVQLLQNKQLVDEVTQPLGLRTFNMDADSGFVLNGSRLDLYGFGRHEDVAGRGSALHNSDHEKDMALIVESGATAMRLTHYPHSRYFYDLADQNGIVLWTEIPLVGPGGYTGTGFINTPELKTHARQLLTELIRQHYNHPSIIFWGLFNELKLDYDDPIPFLTELMALAKKEDPSRIITSASFIDTDHFNAVSDVIAWNKYYGWYGGAFEDIGTWADDMHRQFPGKPIAVSEYGAGANIHQHQEILEAPDPDGDFHPEEWQTAYHEANWEALIARPFVWGKFVWALADFGSAIRDEGGCDGLNDKGLVTYDRETRKDAFYFYKANWNPEPMLHLTEKRATRRKSSTITVKAYTNLNSATLYVNNKSVGTVRRDSLGRVIWKRVALRPGENHIVVKTKINGHMLLDSCSWHIDAL